jgi:hypothetical protein
MTQTARIIFDSSCSGLVTSPAEAAPRSRAAEAQRRLCIGAQPRPWTAQGVAGALLREAGAGSEGFRGACEGASPACDDGGEHRGSLMRRQGGLVGQRGAENPCRHAHILFSRLGSRLLPHLPGADGCGTPGGPVVAPPGLRLGAGRLGEPPWASSKQTGSLPATESGATSPAPVPLRSFRPPSQASHGNAAALLRQGQASRCSVLRSLDTRPAALASRRKEGGKQKLQRASCSRSRATP